MTDVEEQSKEEIEDEAALFVEKKKQMSKSKAKK